MSNTIFVTGTDTGCGKTHVAAALIRALCERGIEAVGFKPVAAGCEATAAGWRNDDALALQAASAFDIDYELINPYALAPPVAPHLAAAEAGAQLDAGHILGCHAELASRAEVVVVEGAGGWRVPLGDGWDFADLVARAGWPVLLVVGMRLGCLNHALLTADAVVARSRLVGWVANCLPPGQERLADNIDTLRARMPAPCLSVVGADRSGESAIDPDAFLVRIMQ